MRKRYPILLVLAVFVLHTAFYFVQDGGVFVANNGTVKFTSKAPLETISAQSKKLSGALDAGKRTFAFSIPIKSFEGFNSPLQKEHFNENYMESEKIPSASFKGKIIEEVDLSVAGAYTVRAKGMMKIHDVEKEMIIKSRINVKSGQISVETSFNVPLKDYNINVPTIVNQKIAPEILVEVKMDMTPKK